MSRMQRRLAIAAVTLTYVAVTVGESILAPILPIARPRLGLTEAGAGQILGVLSISAAVGNLIGGFVLGRFGAKLSSMAGVGLTSAGAGLAAVNGGAGAFAIAHVLMGLGAGVFFAGGIFSIGVLVDPGRRGRAMGLYGIAYSLALALAAGLVAVIGPDAWRTVFVVAAWLGLIALVAVALVDVPGRVVVPKRDMSSGLRLLGVPVAVGAAAAVAQFGLVAYVPTFAVDDWAYSASAAASVLLVGRILSIPGKAWAGRLADRHGAISAARRVTVVLVAGGIAWLAIPWPAFAAVAAAVFAGAASSMFPVANVVAVERFGDRGGLLGVFRSAQMAVGGVSVWLVGVAASTIELEVALLVGVVGLGTLLPFLRGRDRETVPT